MSILRWLIFRFMFWLQHSRKTRKKLCWIVDKVDAQLNPSWQPMRGTEKFNTALVLAMEFFGRKKRPPAEEKIVRSVERAVQLKKGRKFVSARQTDGNLYKMYKKKNRKVTDKSWGIKTDEDSRRALHAVLSIQKEKAISKQVKRK